MDWNAVGALGQWAGAVGTSAALIAAVVLLKLERARDGDRQRLLDRSQAERVAAWPSEVRSDFADPASPRKWGAALRNASDLPVYQVHLEFCAVNGRKRAAAIFEVVPPGEWLLSGRDLYRRPEREETGPNSRGLSLRKFVVAVQFTDAADRRWRRGHQGDLVRATDLTEMATAPDRIEPRRRRAPLVQSLRRAGPGKRR